MCFDAKMEHFATTTVWVCSVVAIMFGIDFRSRSDYIIASQCLYFRKPFTPFCGSSPVPSPLQHTSHQSPPPYDAPLSPGAAFLPRSGPSHADRASRLRRQATPLTRNSCPMHLVATGRFHQASNSRNNVESTILFMVSTTVLGFLCKMW